MLCGSTSPARICVEAPKGPEARRAIVVLPFISMVNEKVKHLQRVVAPYNRGRPRKDRIKARQLCSGWCLCTDVTGVFFNLLEFSSRCFASLVNVAYIGGYRFDFGRVFGVLWGKYLPRLLSDILHFKPVLEEQA